MEGTATIDSNDPFSKLPDDIIHHHIFKLITAPKDVVRASAVSKSWLRLRRTYPTLCCSICDFVPNGKNIKEANTEQFIKFVHQSLNTLEISRINSFSLDTYRATIDEVPGWISKALDKHVQHLTLLVGNISDFSKDKLSSILRRVLSADWIKNLSLTGRIAIPTLIDDATVKLSSLTVLSLKRSIINDEQLRQLLHGCPALSELHLDSCLPLSEIDIYENPNLETLEFHNHYHESARVRVRAPKLKQLIYFYHRLTPDLSSSLKVECSPNLRSLNIRSTEINDDLFHKLLAQFPLLETLTVDCLGKMRRIRISNPLLKSICIINGRDKLEDVVIDCKNLSFFKFWEAELSSRPSIRMDNPPNVRVVDISVFDVDTVSWYSQLKEYLTVRQPIFTHLDLLFISVDKTADIKTETAHLLPISACEIEELSVYDCLCSSNMLAGLLSACHPKTIKVYVYSWRNLSSVKLLHEELVNKQENYNCWCKDDFKCWKHLLKDVKIMNINIQGVSDWDILVTQLPTFKEEDFILFKLWW